jgi:hypothetical protein
MSEGFFDRWSRRKQQVRAGQVPEEAPAPPPESLPAPPPPPAAEAAPEPPPLTLADVQALRPDADFGPFVARQVAPEVRNAAFRKLFADPHFNVMDGLDVYIDDYSKPSPLPEGVLRQMASAKFLKLFDEEPAPPEENPEGVRASAVAQSVDPDAQPARPNPNPKNDDHDTDLRLQPDDAPGADGARGRAG